MISLTHAALEKQKKLSDFLNADTESIKKRIDTSIEMKELQRDREYDWTCRSRNFQESWTKIETGYICKKAQD